MAVATTKHNGTTRHYSQEDLSTSGMRIILCIESGKEEEGREWRRNVLHTTSTVHSTVYTTASEVEFRIQRILNTHATYVTNFSEIAKQLVLTDWQWINDTEIAASIMLCWVGCRLKLLRIWVRKFVDPQLSYAHLWDNPKQMMVLSNSLRIN